MISQAPVGSILMFADGAGTATPQYGGTVDIFPKSYINGVQINGSSSLVITPSASLIVQASASLVVNGYLKTKIVQNQETWITGTHTTTSLVTEAQWYRTGSYVFSDLDIDHTIVLGQLSEADIGRVFRVRCRGEAGGNKLEIRTPAGGSTAIIGNIGYPTNQNINGFFNGLRFAFSHNGTAPYTDDNLFGVAELMWNGYKWEILYTNGTWTRWATD